MNDRLKYRFWEHEDWHDDKSPLKAVYCNIVDGCDPTIAVSDFEFCTGLKDKNGNLIYENDLIRVRNETGKVCFGFYRKTEEHFPDGIYGWYIEWEKHNCWLRQDLGYFITEGIEIIGNAHTRSEE